MTLAYVLIAILFVSNAFLFLMLVGLREIVRQLAVLLDEATTE